MNTKTAVLALAIAVSFAGVTMAQDTTSSTTTTTTTPTTDDDAATSTQVTTTTAQPADPSQPATTTEVTTTTAPPTDSDSAATTTAVTTTTTAPPAQDDSAVPVTTTTTTTAADSPPPMATAPAAALTELDVRAALSAQGYTKIHDVEMKDGVWKADAKSADGNKVELRIDGITGKIIPDEPVATISKDAIVSTLLAAKYTDVHDVEFDDGIWKAEAKDPSGVEVDVKLDPNDGHILGDSK